MASTSAVTAPTALERFINRMIGGMVALGIGPKYMHVLQTRGRKSGRLYRTPVNMLEHAGKLWLVAPRGQTQWSQNVDASGELDLQRGSSLQHYAARPAEHSEKPVLLKLYLEQYASQVQRFFSVKASDPVQAFEKIADQYPVYELAAGPVGNRS